MKKERKKHSKKFKIILISSILAVITIIATGAGMWFGFTDPALSRKLDVGPFYSTWMSNVKDETCIKEVIIPGSHDSGTNKMMPQAMCQGHDIIDQLKGGVRYFDVRVTKDKDDLKIFHGPIKGQKFDKVINEFATFIQDNPSEFVILDFQHFGNNAEKETADMLKRVMPMKNMLKSNEYQNINDVTFKDLRDNKINFMVVWSVNGDENRELCDNSNFYERANHLMSEYNGKIHKESDEALIKEFDNYYANEEEDKLFVLQGQRTAKTLLGKPCMYEKGFAPKVNEFINGIANDASKLAKTNIIMRDFIVSDINKVNSILRLNIAKKTIKDTCIDLFINATK